MTLKTASIKLSQITKHPNMRMDAEYHIGIKEGKKAYEKLPDGTLKLNDKSGKIMLKEKDAKEYNATILLRKKCEAKLKKIIK